MNSGIYHGSDALVYIRTAVSPDVYTPVGHATSHSLDVKSETIVRRTKSTGSMPTRKLVGIDASISMDALVLYNGYSFENLLTAQLAGNQLLLQLRGHDNEDWGVEEDLGDWYIQMGAIIGGNNAKWPLNADASYAASFDLSGSLTIETAPADND
jgi:hypothetical protein